MLRFASVALLAAALALPAVAQAPSPADRAKVQRVLEATPLIDGHNDIPWAVRKDFGGDPGRPQLDKTVAQAQRQPPLHTDIPRLRAGGVGGQFWSVYVPVDLKGADAVKAVAEQTTVVREMVALHPTVFELAYTAADIVRIHKAGRIASLMGAEGGHSIENSLPALRALHQLGVRYMTLTHSANTDWADSATDTAVHGGLTPFGEAVVREMNRLGMLVDLSHVSPETMQDALRVTLAPVIFSHSSAKTLTPHPRNVPDEVLAQMKVNGGVVMVTFVPPFVNAELSAWTARRLAQQATNKDLKAWEAANPAPKATLAQVADHIEHVRKVAGVDHVGIGGDYDGVESLPVGLEDVSTYPALLAELSRRGWSEADLRKLTGENVLRVMRGAEATARRLRSERPSYTTPPAPQG
jgi:membrane dipeptidase